MPKSPSQEELDERVYFCRSCHSLDIRIDDEMVSDDWDGSYCGKCHSTDIGECTIGEWLEEENRRMLKRKDPEWRR